MKKILIALFAATLFACVTEYPTENNARLDSTQDEVSTDPHWQTGCPDTDPLCDSEPGNGGGGTSNLCGQTCERDSDCWSVWTPGNTCDKCIKEYTINLLGTCGAGVALSGGNL